MRLVPLLLFGCVLAAQGQQAAQDKCRIEGKVVSSVTGEPLRKVRVNLTGSPTALAQRAPALSGSTVTVFNSVTGGQIMTSGGRISPFQFSAVTDSTGAFAFGSLDPGRYSLYAQRDGYQYSTPQGGRGSEMITLAAGDQKKDIVLRLAPLSVLTGHIRDEDGDPIRRAQASLMLYQYGPNGRQLQQRYSATSDDRGEFRIFDVQPGKYYVRASSQGVITSASDQDEVLTSTYYPGTTDPAAAAQLDVRPGDEIQGMDLTLRRMRGATIRGRIIRPPGMAAQMGVSVNAMFISGDSMTSTRGSSTDQQGNFTIRGLLPGSYMLNS